MPAGRPRKELGPEAMARAEAMASHQCTAEEVAGVLGMSVQTLGTRLKEIGFSGYQEFRAQKGAVGRVALRQKQWEAAERGDTAMLIWLGKQWLGQKNVTSTALSNMPWSPDYAEAVVVSITRAPCEACPFAPNVRPCPSNSPSPPLPASPGSPAGPSVGP